MILGYLRASTTEQNSLRAQEAMEEFATANHITIDSYFNENVSGATLERPELNRMLDACAIGDIVIVEQIDRLTRLSSDDWKTLKRIMDSKRVRVVSIDLPTSYQFLKQSDASLTNEILDAVNSMLMDILATTARKDYEDRRRRQAEGISLAKAEGKYKGRSQSPKTVEAYHKVNDLIDKGVSVEDSCKVVGIGRATYYRLKKNEL